MSTQTHSPKKGKRLRILIVDDSAVCRATLRRLFAQDPSFEVIGEAGHGKEGVALAQSQHPDLVLMDVMMPLMDGVEATEILSRAGAFRVVLISDLAERDGHLNFKALQAGALELWRKPTLRELRDPTTGARMLRKLRLLAEVPRITRKAKATPQVSKSRSKKRPSKNQEGPFPAGPLSERQPGTGYSLLCVGASTGGPMVLKSLLANLPTTLPWPILITQHMTPGFTVGMTQWLAESCNKDVRLAEVGDVPQKGVVYVAPDGRHMEMGSQRIRLVDGEPYRGHRPAVNRLFSSVAHSGLGPMTIAVQLTGMGDDGALGIQELHRRGAWTIAQDEASAVIHSMPRSAIDLGAIDEVVGADDLADRLCEIMGLSLPQS